MELETNILVNKPDATTIELYIINKVKEYRIKAKYNKRQLSLELRLSENHVAKVESSKCKTKYNVNQLNELAKILGCTVADFMPSPFVTADTIEEYMELHPKIKAKYEIMAKNYEEKERKKIEEKERKKKEKAAMKKKATSKKK